MLYLKKITHAIAILLAFGILACCVPVCQADYAEELARRFPIPENGTAKEYIEFLKKVVQAEQEIDSGEELDKFRQCTNKVVYETAKKMATLKDISDEEFLLMVVGLHLHHAKQSVPEDDFRHAVYKSIFDKLLPIARKANLQMSVDFMECYSLSLALPSAVQEGEAAVRAVVEKMEAIAFDGGAMERDNLFVRENMWEGYIDFLQEAVYAAASISDEFELELLQKFDEKTKEIPDVHFTDFMVPLRQRQLKGPEIKISGKFTDGTPIDMEALKGKVVLIFIKWYNSQQYDHFHLTQTSKKYREKGFEMLSFFQRDDDNKEEFLKENGALGKLACLEDTKINGIDLKDYFLAADHILIGRDGKVISIEADGEELDRLLKEQFPEE